MLTGAVVVTLAYLLGSVSTAIVVCRLMGLPDPRTEGSNNPGATNVLRIGGKKAAALTPEELDRFHTILYAMNTIASTVPFKGLFGETHIVIVVLDEQYLDQLFRERTRCRHYVQLAFPLCLT
jgi:acyl-phosphate glycerol 3-phosphate acyltransferase